ncbi:MAG: sugar nucleotide-binding protein [Fuerstiella sp.]
MIILLGGNGYVGSAFRQELEARRLNFLSLSRAEGDYTHPLFLRSALQKQKATFVINCAGYTGKPNVDACEIHKTECLQGNAVLPGTIADVCGNLGIPWGHVSSGCIFTGSKPDGSGFSETDIPNFTFRQNNCSFYSGCKALGEEVLATDKNCYIWRLRIPFSEVDSHRNYLSKLQRYNKLLNATNSLSDLGDFARCCVDCIDRSVPLGTYNLTNPGAVTTEQVVKLIQKHGNSQQQFSFFTDESEFMNMAAKTPRSNCVLDCSKAIAAGLHLMPVEDAIERALKQWVPETRSH